jgi:hypothetical protein
MDNQALQRIISDYNYNQERYNRNMSSFIGILSSRERRNNINPFEMFTFTQGDITSLMNLFDFSGGTFLSEEQINQSTTVSLHQHSQLNPVTCPITLEVIGDGESVMKINRCGHLFKESSLRQWLQGHSQCPVCRGNVEP